MYDELIEELRRHHCDAKEDDTQEVCEECAYDVIIADKSVPSGIASVCVCGLMNRAADAIEQLSNSGSAYGRGWTLGYDAGRDENKPRWISVEERLPDQNSGNLYICLIVGGDYGQLSWYELCDFAEGQFWIQDQLYEGHVTHWMPLPEPPKEET